MALSKRDKIRKASLLKKHNLEGVNTESPDQEPHRIGAGGKSIKVDSIWGAGRKHCG